MTAIRESILRASLPHLRAQSFTRQAIRAGLADLPSSSSPASSLSSLSRRQDPDYVLENIFGEENTAEKELVRLWEDEGIKNMSVEGQGEASGSASGLGLREVMGRRLRYSEETAGEHVVQAHAIMQSPSSISPPSFNFPTPIARMIDHLQSRLTRELSEFELYRPPAAPLSTAGTVASSSLSSLSMGAPTSTMRAMVAESALNAAVKASSIATSAAAGLSAVSSKLSSSASSPSTSPSPPNSNSNSTSTSTSTGNSPLPSAHHLPLPLPPNPLRSFMYAWNIADEALHLAQPASYRALNDNDNTRSTSSTEEVERRRSQATLQATGQWQATGREGGKDDVLRMGEGQGWEWYVRRGVLAGIYLRAESILMQPRALLGTADQPLARATERLDELLENNYELAVRRLTLRGPLFGRPGDTSNLGAGGNGEEGRVLKDLAGFGMFVYKSWGGLFRSRGWIK
ncbi:hypothetical protein FFLO_05957 [Filobasidium floriforme]|uniref:Ubiquinone biosynthesis protein n=1 Tax=Filobasidium floriforme TaxID=5210 RepID=A0A8K0NMP6_9TREE|nr:uncharacterized protein HD553DRAFT_320947 [Filobasidium floriforme]KAG7528731.1 hypothetical protein FFLO_05957 [Filobasidium floriforme]KAH8077290.1 hypothetical protein HD553DRAFT_320947 [Filobasidium floriforme]